MKTKDFLIICTFLLIINQLAYSEVIQDQSETNSGSDTSICVASDTVVHLAAEKMATFQGGDILMFRNYVLTNIRYPVNANINGIQGKVVVIFVVDWDGTMKSVKLLKSSGHPELDIEVLKVVANSPQWSPAKDKNICVPLQFTLPVEFISHNKK